MLPSISNFQAGSGFSRNALCFSNWYLQKVLQLKLSCQFPVYKIMFIKEANQIV